MKPVQANDGAVDAAIRQAVGLAQAGHLREAVDGLATCALLAATESLLNRD